MKRAVVLLSGGLDSATAAAMAKREGWELFALTVKYGEHPTRRRMRVVAPRQVLSIWGASRG